MKETKLDNLCRIVIPVSTRKNLGMKQGTPLKIEQVDDYIVIRLAKNVCRLCGSHAVSRSKLMICDTCIEKIKKI